MKAAPVSEMERIRQLDIIRGFALFGILLVNMPSFLHPALFMPGAGLPAEHSLLDEWIRLFFDMFVQTKFYTIFSFLFGAGFYLFMSRAEQKGLPMNQLFLRRLVTLLLIGILHLFLLWYGDILHTYAVAGFILMLFYRKKKKTVHRWAWTLLILMQAMLGLTLLIPENPENRSQALLAQRAIDVYNHGTWAEWMQFRWLYEIPYVLGNEVLALLSVLPLFLLGFSAAREGVFARTAEYKEVIRRIWRVSLLLSIPLIAMIPLLQYSVVRVPAPPQMAALVFVNWSGLTLCAFYICSFLLLLSSERWSGRLTGLALVGRMSLTHYLLHTVVFVSITRLFSLYGTASLALGVLMCVGLFACQIAVSRWWLARFAFGPMEWVWRCCTYAEIVPFRRGENTRQG